MFVQVVDSGITHTGYCYGSSVYEKIHVLVFCGYLIQELLVGNCFLIGYNLWLMQLHSLVAIIRMLVGNKWHFLKFRNSRIVRTHCLNTCPWGFVVTEIASNVSYWVIKYAWRKCRHQENLITSLAAQKCLQIIQDVQH